MKKIRSFSKLLCLFLISANSLFSQDYSKVDETVKTYPESFTSLEKLAERINKDFTKDDEKARAIYAWMAFHIKYDLAAAKNIAATKQVAFSFKTEEEKIQKQQQFRQDMALKTLRTKKGVCQNYAALFHGLCDLTGLKCLDIPGTSKVHPAHIGKLPKMSDHMWNAVKIGDKWKLVDVTWGAGSVDGKTGKFVQKYNDGYFLTDPGVFYLNHFPDDKNLLMINKTEEDWAQLPLYYGEYIKAPYQFTSPDTGVFTDRKVNVIPFEIIDLPETDKVAYVFSSENIFKEINVKREGNVSKFDIVMDERSRGFLTIFINNKSVATYKLAR